MELSVTQLLHLTSDLPPASNPKSCKTHHITASDLSESQPRQKSTQHVPVTPEPSQKTSIRVAATINHQPQQPPPKMASLLSLLNRLIPFATPGTPVIQDLLHLATVCTLLYFAPHLQDHLQTRATTRHQPATQPAQDDPVRAPTPRAHDAPAAPAAPAPVPAPAPAPPPILAPPPEPDARGAPAATTARNVGAKKAKSLARRDQRRAYHEFVRTQGEAARAADAEGAAEREAAARAERARRGAAEAALEAARAEERRERKERAAGARRAEARAREEVVGLVREGAWELGAVAERVGGVDAGWVEGVVRASGMVGRKGEELTVVTETGWVVRVSGEQMGRVYRRVVEEGGGAGFERLGRLVEEELGVR